MKTRSTLIVIVLSVLFLGRPVSAQNTILDGYIQEGINSNLQLRQATLEYNRSVESLNQARSLFLPHVAFNASYMVADGGRSIEFPVGDLMNPVYATLNQLTGSDDFQPIENANVQFLPSNFHDTKIRVIQPLFNPDIYFNYKARKELISMEDAKRESYRNDLVYSISSAYYQYLQSEQVLQILSETRLLLEELVRVNESFFKNGRVTRDAVLNAQYELSAIDVRTAQAHRDHAVAKAYFNFLLNRDLSSEIIRDTLLLDKTPIHEDLTTLRDEALHNRAELKQVQSGMRANERVIELSKANSLMPTIAAVGDVGYQGFGYQFDSEQQYWLVQFSLTWDLFKGGDKKAKVQQAKIDYEISENQLEQLKKQVELQVIQSYRELEASIQTLLSARIAQTRAEKAFQIVDAKYKEGQALLLEYLDAQNKMTTAKLSYSIATYDVLAKDAALKKTIANL